MIDGGSAAFATGRRRRHRHWRWLSTLSSRARRHGGRICILHACISMRQFVQRLRRSLSVWGMWSQSGNSVGDYLSCKHCASRPPTAPKDGACTVLFSLSDPPPPLADTASLSIICGL